MIKMKRLETEEINLAAPCGFYCGTCRFYLARSKGQLEERGLKQKSGCMGCRIKDINCAHIKKDCELLRKKERDFCYECNDFPCENLEKLNERHIRTDNINMIDNLLRIKEIGAKQWLIEQEKKWTCKECGGNICVIGKECYDCGGKYESG